MNVRSNSAAARSPEWAAPVPLLCLSALMLLVAIPTTSYEYIKLMRWIVFLTFSWSAFIAWHSKRTSAVLLHLVMAILFNPVISFHFPKEVWITLDMIAALLTFLVAWASRQRNPTAQERENMGDMIGFVIGLSALIGGVVLGLYIAGLFGLGSTASGLLAFATSSAALYAAVLTFHRFRTRMPQSERGPN